MNHYCSPTPPKNPKAGDLWYNTNDNEFYVMDDANRWIAVDDDGLVTDIIIHDDLDDPYKAYDRAMGII